MPKMIPTGSRQGSGGKWLSTRTRAILLAREVAEVMEVREVTAVMAVAE